MGGLDEPRLRAPVAAPQRQVAREVGDRELRGDLARLRAAHAVGDDEDRGALQVGILVGGALTTGVRARDVLRDPQHQPSS